ncbi:MAG: ArsA family ATPase [Acidimicrobiales bacterium]
MFAEGFEYPFPLLIIAGKGGVGKTVLTTRLGSLAAEFGRSTLVVELGGQSQIPRRLGVDEPVVDNDGVARLDANLGWASLSPERLLAGWLSGRNMGLIADRLESSGALGVVSSSIPGIKDVLVLGQIRSWLDSGRFERVFVDAPASGRVREMMRAPRLLAEATEEGPVADQAQRAHELVVDHERCALLLVTTPEETPINETIETAFEAEDDPGIHLAGVVVNRVFPIEEPPNILEKHPTGELILDRYSREREQIERLRRELPVPLELVPETGDEVVDSEPAPSDRGAVGDASLLDRRVLVTVGTGGVGKTSIAAAAAARAAIAGRSVALVTIDPARRLADALGVDLDDELHDVDVPGSTGRLRATMLNSRETFGRVIRANAPDVERAETILASPLSSGLADALAGMTEYMAVERLYELVGDESIDLIVVDTPPSGDAIAFLDAPNLLTRLLDNRIYKLLVHSGARWSVIRRALGGLVGQLVAIAGGAVIADAVHFFRQFDGMEEGFRERSRAMYELLRSDDTAFVVVASPTGQSLDAARDFTAQLGSVAVAPTATVVNRCIAEVGEWIGPTTGSAAETRHANELLEHLRHRRAAEQRRLELFVEETDIPVCTVVELAEPVTNMRAVGQLAEALSPLVD